MFPLSRNGSETFLCDTFPPESLLSFFFYLMISFNFSEMKDEVPVFKENVSVIFGANVS